MATRQVSNVSSGGRSYLTPITGFSGGSGAEWNNREQWARMPKTADQQVLAQTYQRSKAAHDALMRAQAMQAEDDNQILATATPDELANLFGQPRTEREARLQKIVQKDATARDLGVRLMGTESEKLKFAQARANLQRTNLQNYLDPLRFGLEQNRFGETVSQNDRNYLNQLAQRKQAQDSLAATERFRQIQAMNAAANRAQRGQIHQQDFDQRGQFHGDSQANSELAQMIAMERMLQDKAEADQRQKNVEANSLRRYFGDVAAAANAGALAPNQLGQFASRFDPATMAILNGYATVGAERNSFGGKPSAQQAGPQPSVNYLDAFSNLNPSAGRAPLNTPMGTGLDPGWEADYGDEGDSSFGVGNDFSAPAAAPMTAQPAQRPQYTPGTTIRDSRTGQKYLVLPNGKFRPV